MKRGLILSVFLIILIISISFISANPFTDFFKKLTGQAIEQAKTPIQNQITQIQSITPEPVPTASNIVKCSDSDGKSNFLESGYVNFNSKTYYDYCDNNLAYDYYCPSSSNIVANVIKIIGNAITEQTAPDKTSKDCTSYGTNYQCSEGKCIKVGDCLNGETKPCEINIGACKPGVQVCVNFYWSECQNQILPSTEICDSIDNDCDNLIDEINCTIVQNQTNQTIPTHKTCLGNSCISINGQGTDECYFDDQCIVNETTPIEKPNFFAGILGIASETPETQEEINPVYSNKPITKTTYIYAGNLVASKKNNESETTYYVQDHLGSNRKVVDGQIEEQSTDFYAFGETKETTGDSENDYLYTGKELDETGLYYYGARYYNPELGRFTQPDSLTGSLADPLSMNRYSYVQNNPLKYVDPSGNDPLETIREQQAARIKMKYLSDHMDNLEEAQTELEGIESAFLQPADIVLIGGALVNTALKLKEAGMTTVKSVLAEQGTRSKVFVTESNTILKVPYQAGAAETEDLGSTVFRNLGGEAPETINVGKLKFVDEAGKAQTKEAIEMTNVGSGNFLASPDGKVLNMDIIKQVTPEQLDQLEATVTRMNNLGKYGSYHNDIHPGNIYLNSETNKLGLADWGHFGSSNNGKLIDRQALDRVKTIITENQ